MKLCIITGGSIEPSFVRDRLAEEHPDCILAADHGLVFCRREQIVPDYIVGDFDSTDPEIVRYYREDGSIPIDTYQPEKDFTDTDIAIQKAIALGADEVILFGATGSRLDHTLSNIWNLSAFCREGIKACIEDPHNRITMLPGREYRLRRDEQFGNRISLFPFGGTVEGLTLSGCRYPVTNARLTWDNGGRFVSNEISDEVFCICWKSGVPILMETRD